MKTTQNRGDLGQVGIDNAMIDLIYDMQNRKSENKNDKVGYGILFHMIKLEPGSEIEGEIHLGIPALQQC